MMQGTDSDLYTILRCFCGKVIQLLEMFKDIPEEHHNIGSNHRICSNEYSDLKNKELIWSFEKGLKQQRPREFIFHCKVGLR